MKYLLIIALLTCLAGCGGSPNEGDQKVSESNVNESELAAECRAYLEKGPPEHMDNYVPDSLTEVIIAHGAEGKPLDPELSEIGSIVVLESENLSEIEDAAIREYMQEGADLVRRVVESQ